MIKEDWVAVEASPVRRGRKITRKIKKKIIAFKYEYFMAFVYVMLVSLGKGTLAPLIAY